MVSLRTSDPSDNVSVIEILLLLWPYTAMQLIHTFQSGCQQGRETGKRKIGEAEPLKLPVASSMLPPVAVDRFGVINVLNTDKFGALRVLGESRPNVCRRINNTEESSTGSLTSFLQNMQGGKDWQRVDAILSTDGESTMSNNASEGVENEGTSSHLYDPSSQFSAPLCSTIQERTSNSSGAGRLPTMRFCPPPNHVSDLSTSSQTVYYISRSR